MPKPLKLKVDARHEARKIVLQAWFERSFHPCDLNETATRIKDEMVPTVCDEELMATLLSGIEKNQENIDQLIARCAPEWPLHQLPKIDLNVLRIAIYELYIARSVPPKVAIDEAVELAKEFSGDNAGSFVNGALSTIIKLQDKQADTETALFIGYFQPFHKGHLRAIKQIASRFPKIIVAVITDREFSTTKNPNTPLSFEEIKESIENVLSTASFVLDQRVEDAEEFSPEFTIVDVPPVNGDRDWIEKIQKNCPLFAVVYTNNEKIGAFFIDAKYPVFKTLKYKSEKCNSTEIRRRIALGQAWQQLVPPKIEKYLKDKYILKRIKNNAIARM